MGGRQSHLVHILILIVISVCVWKFPHKHQGHLCKKEAIKPFAFFEHFSWICRGRAHRIDTMSITREDSVDGREPKRWFQHGVL